MSYAKNWESIKAGFVLRTEDGRYIWEICAEGHPERPTVYYTKYLWEAKSWKSEQAVFKAEARIRDQAGRCDVLYFEYDEKQMVRQIKATVT